MNQHAKSFALFTAFWVAVVAPGCTLYPGYTVAQRIDGATSEYADAARQVQLGDSKDDVLALLETTQDSLLPNERKPADRFVSNESNVEIHYFRSRRQADGLTTDDEFTPYVFLEGQLIAIGWAILGGPSSQARSIPRASTTSELRVEDSVRQEGHGKVYHADECIGPIINGMCHGTILPKNSYHPTCYGEWVGGRCTGPQF